MLRRELIGVISKEVGALRRDMVERVDDLGRQLVGRVEDIGNDVRVLRGHLGDLHDEVIALRGDIVGRR